MAIDFFVMPLSRYIAGDFVSPAMRTAWDAGLPYTLILPNERRDIPIGSPFGGPDAPARRHAILPMLAEDLALLPAPASWDERSDAEPVFHRVDTPSYQALLEEAHAASRPSWLGVFGAPAAPLHLTASLFLPCAIPAPYAMTTPFERVTGSVAAALAELQGRRWKPASAAARETLRTALEDAARREQPLIVDW